MHSVNGGKLDYGQRVIDEIFNKLQIDEEWSVRTARSFKWWAGPLRQHVWADKPFWDEGMKVVRVHARTDLMHGYQGTAKQKALLNILLMSSTLSGVIRNPKNPTRLQLASSIYVNESTIDWISDFFSWAVVTQVTEAHLLALHLTEMFETAPDASKHPISGSREDLDQTLEIISEVIRPEGEFPCRYIGEEMLDLVKMIQKPPTVMANGDATGLTSELPCAGRTSMLRFNTDESNPRMKHGLFTKLSLPFHYDDPVEEALLMNERELREMTQSHFLGSWCQSDQDAISFVSFYSNAMSKSNLLMNIYMSSLLRAKWVAEQVYGDDWINGGFERAVEAKMATWGLHAKEIEAGKSKGIKGFLSKFMKGRR